MSQLSLKKIKFSKVSETKKTNDLIEELNMVIDEIDEYFKNVHSGLNSVKYTYELNSKVNESNSKFLEEFKDDLNKNGYDCVFQDVLVRSKSEPPTLVLIVRLAVNIKQL